MSRPRAAFHAQLRGDASVHEVLRAFMEHREWLVPLSFFDGDELAAARKVSFGPRHQLPRSELWVFSEQATAQQAVVNGNLLGTYVAGVPGIVLFERIPEDATQVRVNCGGWEQDALEFDAQGFQLLTGWARTVRLERLLQGCADPASSPKLLDDMRAHESYRVPFLPDGRMVSKPGHDGFEQPSVVCTSIDSYEAFLEALDAELREQIRCEVLDGPQLCDRVRPQKIDALFLNPMGPGPTRTLPKQLCDAITA